MFSGVQVRLQISNVSVVAATGHLHEDDMTNEQWTVYSPIYARTNKDLMSGNEYRCLVCRAPTSRLFQLRQRWKSNLSGAVNKVFRSSSLSPHPFKTSCTSELDEPTSTPRCSRPKSSMLRAATRLESASSCDASSEVGCRYSLRMHLQSQVTKD